MAKLINLKFIGIFFCYIFSFKIIGPINSSMLVAGIILVYGIFHHPLLEEIRKCLNRKYVVQLFRCIVLLFCISFFIPTIYLTFDYYFSKVFLTLMIQMVLGIIIWGYYQYAQSNEKHHLMDIELIIIYAYLIQSIIQCVVSFTPSLQPIIFYFNGAQRISESYSQLFASGVRGMALSSGTGYSLTLGYGLVYIIYVKRLFGNNFTIYNILIGVLLLVGTFFAGRSGFVGVAIAVMYYFIGINNITLWQKLKNIIKLLLCVCFICAIIYALLPSFVMHLVNNVFPFAFEPIYNLFLNGNFETASTNDLQNMWSVPVSFREFMIGIGRYYDPITGSYYKHVDIGIFKNLFFWGIGGYLLVIYFQWLQLYPLKYKNLSRNIKWYFLSIFILLFALDFKAISLGLNKTAFSIIILLSLCYEKNTIYHPICSE